MYNKLTFALLFVLFVSCSSSKKSSSSVGYSKSTTTLAGNDNAFSLSVISDDETYGYTQQNPVKVGGAKNSSGPANERKFLNALLGPDGQEVTYYRQGSCCPFKTPNGLIEGAGLLDRYEVKYEGIDKPVILYLNMYDPGEMKAPKGFTFRK